MSSNCSRILEDAQAIHIVPQSSNLSAHMMMSKVGPLFTGRAHPAKLEKVADVTSRATEVNTGSDYKEETLTQNDEL